MYHLIPVLPPSLTKTCALQVFRVVRRVIDGAVVAGEVAQDVGKDIADAWVESGRNRP